MPFEMSRGVLLFEQVVTCRWVRCRGHPNPGDARSTGNRSSSRGVEVYMKRLELTSEQREVLRDTVKRAVADMGVEVLHTDSHDFKQMLKHRLTILEQIAGKLEQPVGAESLSV